MWHRARTAIALTMCIGLLLSACSQLPIDSLWTDRTPLYIAAQLASDLPMEDKNALVDRVHAEYQSNPSNRNLLSVAVSHAIPGNKLSSTTLGLEFLGKVEVEDLDPRSQQFARWLNRELAYRLELEHENLEMARTVEETRAALARAQEKIEILTRIEKTIGSAHEAGIDDTGQTP